MTIKLVIVSIYILRLCDLSKCNKVQNGKLQFIDSPRSWINASKHCKGKGAVLASDKSRIQHEFPDRVNEVWLSSYIVPTKWAYIKGCFKINIKDHTVNGYGEMFYCQKICEGHKYYAYSTMGRDEPCICMDSVTKEIENSCSCNENSCFYIFEYFTPNTTPTKSAECASITTCYNTTMKQFSKCDSHYKVKCDNNVTIGHDNQNYPINMCRENGASIKWLFRTSDSNCTDYWTSGRRGKATLSLRTSDDINRIQLAEDQRCFKLSKLGTKVDQKCKNVERFFCENGPTITTPNDPEELKTIFDSSTGTTNTPAQSSKEAVIVGVNVPVVTVIVIVLVIVLYRLRMGPKDKRKPIDNNLNAPNNAEQNQTQTRQSAVVSLLYEEINDEFFTSLNNEPPVETMLSPNYELAKDAIKEEEEMMPGPTYELENEISKSNTSDIPENYNFAQPIANENDYVYNSDYDHLHKISNPPKESDNVLTCPEIQNDTNSKTFDTFASSHASDGQQAGSDYDHLPTNVGSDPTYECAALKMQKTRRQ